MLFETGRKDFRLTTIIRIAEALGVTMQELFAGLETGGPYKRTKPLRIRNVNLNVILRELAELERGIHRLKDYAGSKSRPAETRNRTSAQRKTKRASRA